MLTNPTARQRMTQRAYIERDPNVQAGAKAGTTPYGGPTLPRFAPLSTLPCWYWSARRVETTAAGQTVVVEDLGLMLPNGADVTERDRVARVTDRKGTLVAQGPFLIQAARQKAGWLEATLKLVTS